MTLGEAFKLANEVEIELDERKQKCDMSEKVEVVIKIPKYYLTHPQDYTCLAECVRRGTPLPKGHGDLVDVDDIRVIELEDSLHTIRHEKGDDIDVYIDADTIIKADAEG